MTLKADCVGTLKCKSSFEARDYRIPQWCNAVVDRDIVPIPPTIIHVQDLQEVTTFGGCVEIRHRVQQSRFSSVALMGGLYRLCISEWVTHLPVYFLNSQNNSQVHTGPKTCLLVLVQMSCNNYDICCMHLVILLSHVERSVSPIETEEHDN